MIISIRRCGGFAGIDQLLGSVDLDRLPATQTPSIQQRLDALLKAAEREGSAIGADQFRYEVRLQESGRPVKTIPFIDDGDWSGPLPKAISELAHSLDIALN
jgi:hypothetical protein